MNFLLSADTALLDAVYSLKCPFLDTVMPLISAPGDGGAVWILLTLVLMLFKKTRKTAYTMALALAAGLILGNLILKPLIARPRPYEFNPSVTLLVGRLEDYSFPSGHTLASFEAATVLLLRHRAKAIPAVILAALIAFSRLYLYVHYPSDVLGGILLGVAIAFGAKAAVDRFYVLYGRKTKKSTPNGRNENGGVS